MERKRKKYEELAITDDFMFGKVMRSPERCGRLLELILGVRIREVVFLDDQESMNPDYEARGIRLDIYLEDEGNSVYNVEMQAQNSGELPERSRYYQAVIDINLIEKGEKYDALKKSYVIFICTFDPFGEGRHIYHFENLCRENPALRLGDGTEKVFLNTKGEMDGADEGLRNLLEYLESLEPQDAYTRELEGAVEAAREHREWRREYMKMRVWEWDIRREERAEGKAEGREEGSLIQLADLVYRKVRKGKSLEETAEELEEDPGSLKRVYDAVVKCLPDYDPEKILEELGGGKAESSKE